MLKKMLVLGLIATGTLGVSAASASANEVQQEVTLSKNRIQQLIHLIHQDQQLQKSLEETSGIQEAVKLIVKSVDNSFTAEEVSKALSQMSANNSDELSEQDLLSVAGGMLRDDCNYTKGLGSTSQYSHSCCV